MSVQHADGDGRCTDSEGEQETDIDDVTRREGEIQELLTSHDDGAADSDSEELSSEPDNHSSPVQCSPDSARPRSRDVSDNVGEDSPPLPRTQNRRPTAPPSYSATRRAQNVLDQANIPQVPPMYEELPALPGTIRLPVEEQRDDRAIELTVIRGAGAPSTGARGPSPAPPSYDEAVARVETGLARQKETSFSADASAEELNVPPPNYTNIDNGPQIGERREERDPTPVSPSTIETAADGPSPSASSSTIEAAADSSPPEDSSFVVIRLCQRFLRSRRNLSPSLKKNIIITSVVLSCLILFIVLFPFQFSYVNYYEYALVRTKSTGRVAPDRVYEHGCYVLGADKEFVYLNRTVQSIEFLNLGMFTKDNVDLAIDVRMYYQLRYGDVPQLWRDYAGNHRQVFENVAKTTIRNCAPRVSQEEYILEREYVQTLLHDALKSKFVTWGITVPYFNYLNLHLPDRIIEKKLQLLIIRTDIEKELAYQQQRKVELETELITTPIIYQAKEAINNGTTKAAAISTVSRATKSQVVDVAHSNAFQSMIETLNVTNMNHSLSFYYLATLNTMERYGGAVEFSKRGLYTPKGV